MKNRFNRDDQVTDYATFYRKLFSDTARLGRAMKELESTNTDEGTRLDLAMAMGFLDNKEVELLLISIAKNCNEPESLCLNCGESLGEIWARQGRIPMRINDELPPEIREIAQGTFRVMMKHK